MTTRLVSVDPVIVVDDSPASEGMPSRGAPPIPDNFLGRLKAAASEKPGAATLIGLGAAWFLVKASGADLRSLSITRDRSGGRRDLMGGESTSSAFSETPPRSHRQGSGVSEILKGVASAVGGSVSQVAGTVGDVASSSSSQAMETVTAGYGALRSAGEAALHTMSGAGSSAYGSVSDAGSSAYEAVSRTGSSAYDVSRDVSRTTSEAVTAFLRRQPLAIGVLGLAMGGGVAALLPGSEIEDRYLGEASDETRSRAKSFASGKMEDIQDAAKDAFDGVVATAKEQGLTASGAAELVRNAGDKIGKVAMAATDSVKSELK